MRPSTLDEFVGQQHFLGEGKLLRRLLAADRLGSVIFYGPPGTGKTTLAHLLAAGQPQQVRAAERRHQRRQGCCAKCSRRPAIGCRPRAIRRCCSSTRSIASTRPSRTCCCPTSKKASSFWSAPRRRILFSRSIGAGQPQPGVPIRAAVERRHQGAIRRALADRERGLGQHDVHMHDDALDFLAEVSDGDARRALSALEIGVLSSDERPIEFTRELAEESVQRKAVEYDGTGDAHYDAISALIKSMRGSDPDAAIYWLARMLEAGEDVRFLARRIVIFASEDVGNADPQALPLAVATMQACEFVGLPECQLNLAQAVTYMACAPKSNASMVALSEATQDVREGRLLPVPVMLRDSHYQSAKRLGHGQGYQYAHDSPTRLPRRTIWASIANTTGRSIGAWNASWPARLETIRARLREAKNQPKPDA